jgi:hypothetical protein
MSPEERAEGMVTIAWPDERSCRSRVYVCGNFVGIHDRPQDAAAQAEQLRRGIASSIRVAERQAAAGERARAARWHAVARRQSARRASAELWAEIYADRQARLWRAYAWVDDQHRRVDTRNQQLAQRVKDYALQHHHARKVLRCAINSSLGDRLPLRPVVEAAFQCLGGEADRHKPLPPHDRPEPPDGGKRRPSLTDYVRVRGALVYMSQRVREGTGAECGCGVGVAVRSAEAALRETTPPPEPEGAEQRARQHHEDGSP